MMSIQTVLEKRRSVRHYDPAAKIEASLLASWIAGASRSPNGNNVQAVRYLRIEDPALREQLLPAAFGQKPVVEASVLLVVLGDYRAFEPDNIRRIHAEGYVEGHFDADLRDYLENAAISYYAGKSCEELKLELTRDASLSAMSLLLLANEAGYHTLTLSGYDSQQLKRTLDLPDRYMDVMLIAIGTGIREGHRTVRHPVEQILHTDRIV